MSHTLETIKSHPHLNPAFFPMLKRRVSAQDANRGMRDFPGHLVAVPKQVNRYLPHYGAKEAAKYAARSQQAEVFGTGLPDALRDWPKRIAAAMRQAIDGATGIAGFAETADETAVTNTGEFSVLDTVTWTSSNKAKTGQVVAVVPAGKLPIDVDVKVKDATSPRDHVSYVVSADGKSYWPRVALLTLA